MSASKITRAGDCPACGAPCPVDQKCPTCHRAPAADRVGRVLADRYRLEEVVGRGGFGIVYRAKHVGLGADVAVKFLLAEWARAAEIRARFEREAAALVRVRHPGIVAAIDFAEDHGDLYLVMEWVEGTDLSKLVVAEGETLPPERIVGILDQVLDVLEVAHAEGIVHRDLKPENIKLQRDKRGQDRVKVFDFGLALINDGVNDKRLTASDAVNGTCYYMSPEQCRGRDVGPASDVYAIGVILFELLAGEPPFLGETSIDVMMQQMVVEPPAVRDRGVMRDPPPGLEALARACLAKKPEARPTVAALRAELRAFSEGRDATTRAIDAAHERSAAASRTRSERAIGRIAVDADEKPAERATVLAWGFTPDADARIRGALGMHGLRARPWTGKDPPSDESPQTIVIPGDEHAATRIDAIRKATKLSRVPVLVADLASAERTPALIRAGASDVSLSSVGEDVLVQKVLRLVRRKR